MKPTDDLRKLREQHEHQATRLIVEPNALRIEGRFASIVRTRAIVAVTNVLTVPTQAGLQFVALPATNVYLDGVQDPITFPHIDAAEFLHHLRAA